MTVRLLPFAALAVAMALQAPSALAQTVLPAQTWLITMQGRGEVKATPDMAVVAIGVTRHAASAREALDANNEAMQQVLASLKAQGIEERDVQTSSFTVAPRYVYPPNDAPKPDGYEVSNQVTVRLRDLAKLGPLLDQAVTDGSNQIQGVSFAIAEPEPLADEARKLAVADALRKAKLYAEAAQVRLGPITQIQEQGGYRPPQPFLKGMRMAAEASSVPIAQGEQSIEVEVSISWEIR